MGYSWFMTIDRRFKRISDGLQTADLVQRTLDVQTAFGFGNPLNEDSTESKRFLDFYSVRGMRRVFEAYGIHGSLEDKGYRTYEIRFSSSGPNDHRMQVLIDGRMDDDHRLIDLKVSLKRVRPAELLAEGGSETPYSVLLVNWLAMQDPQAELPPKHPLVPGQRYPGLGIAYTIHNMLLLMARRLDHDGVTNVPERFHLAHLYFRYGYLSVDELWKNEMLGVAADLKMLPPAVLAWACERGCIKRADGETWSYRPGTLVAPVSKRMTKALNGPWRRLRKHVVKPKSAGVTLDVSAFRESLEKDPVSGIDPAVLQTIKRP
jgi:hypothetical protein